MEGSKIEWCDHTFNPWMGCTKVSEGCKHCYAEDMMDKRYGKVKWGPQGKRVRTSAANWKKPLAWNRKAEQEGRRYRVFCASLADVFEDKKEVEQWRFDLFRLIEATPNLDWLLLTKRIENVMKMIRHDWGEQLPHNIWIGISVENQEQADKRIPELLKIPAKVRFLSMEPLLGAVQINKQNGSLDDVFALGFGIHWVIVGGESGANARPMHMEWVGDIVQQCKNANVSVFVKQMGDNPFLNNKIMKQRMGKKGNDTSKWPTALMVREVPNA